MNQIGVGIVGLGGIGKRAHLPGYLEIPEAARVTALCDVNEASLATLSSRCHAKAYTKYEDLLADPNVDAVDVCLPHYLHGRVALAALEAGKHVIVEKPIATSVDEAEELIRKADENNVILMVAENTRFVKAYQTVRRLLDHGVIGQIGFARTFVGGSEIKRLSDEYWTGKVSQAGGGVLFDAGVHSYYLVEWMIGQVISVFAFTTRFLKNLPVDVEDNATGILRIKGDTIASFGLTNTTQAPWTERLELYGTEGSITVDMLGAPSPTIQCEETILRPE